jgi:DNA-binding protein YbaB
MKNLINAATELKKSVDATQSEADRILFEQNADQQTVIFEILVKYRLKYAEIDEKFTKEINENIKRAARDHCNCCMWLKS